LKTLRAKGKKNDPKNRLLDMMTSVTFLMVSDGYISTAYGMRALTGLESGIAR
jgi:hypothetical protein